MRTPGGRAVSAPEPGSEFESEHDRESRPSRFPGVSLTVRREGAPDLHSFTNDRRQCPAATIARVMESTMPWWNATRMPGFFGLRFTAWKSRNPTDTCATAR